MAELANIHPGDVLREEFIAPMGLTLRHVADATGLLPDDLNLLIEGRRQVDTDLARRLSRFFGTSVQFWLGLQGITTRRLHNARPDPIGATHRLHIARPDPVCMCEPDQLNLTPDYSYPDYADLSFRSACNYSPMTHTSDG